MTAEVAAGVHRLAMEMRALAVLLVATFALSACASSGSERATAPVSTTTTSTTAVEEEERVVYVYRQDVPVDALPASPLARQGILLPVPQCGEVPQNTLEALRKIGATRVRRVGGPEAVCDDVMAQLESAIAKR